LTLVTKKKIVFLVRFFDFVRKIEQEMIANLGGWNKTKCNFSQTSHK